MARKRTNKPKRLKVVKLSKKALTAALAKQKQAAQVKRAKLRRESAVKRFRPRKAERGHYVFISTTGKRDAGKKGRKGYVVKVTRTGKKRLVKTGTGFNAQRLRDVKLPLTKQGIKAAKTFYQSKLVRVGGGKAQVKGRGKQKVSSAGGFDFTRKVSDKLARSIKRTIEKQAGQRNFLVESNVLVQLPDGTSKVYNIQVPIQKADHISIQLGGIKNFVRQKVYAHMAKELAFDGYVTAGSANHVRRLAENRGKEKEDWTKRGVAWEGRHDMQTVHIRSMEWQIEQMK